MCKCVVLLCVGAFALSVSVFVRKHTCRRVCVFSAGMLPCFFFRSCKCFSLCVFACWFLCACVFVNVFGRARFCLCLCAKLRPTVYVCMGSFVCVCVCVYVCAHFFCVHACEFIPFCLCVRLWKGDCIFFCVRVNVYGCMIHVRGCACVLLHICSHEFFFFSVEFSFIRDCSPLSKQ